MPVPNLRIWPNTHALMIERNRIMSKELVSKYLVQGHKVVTVETKLMSDRIDQITKDIVSKQNSLKRYS